MILTDGKTFEEVCQEIADALVKQGGQCRNTVTNSCAYGNDKGQHCAIGWLLPDDRERLMGFSGGANTLITHFRDLGPNDAWLREHKSRLMTIQRFHDKWRAYPTETLPDNVAEIFSEAFAKVAQ